MPNAPAPSLTGLPLANPTHFHPVPLEHKLMWIANTHASYSPFCRDCKFNDTANGHCTLYVPDNAPLDCPAYEAMNPFNYYDESTGERYHD